MIRPILIIFAVLLPVAGCSRSEPSSNPASASSDLHESWDVYLLQKQRIGYGRTTVRRMIDRGQQRIATESLNHLSVKRGGQATKEDIRTSSVETPEGRLIRFECEMRMGPNPLRTTGRVQGDRLILETTGGGSAAPVQASLPWSDDFLGPFAVEQTLQRRPMQPGEQRSLKMLMVGFNQVSDVVLAAKTFEPVQLTDGLQSLLRIETTTRLNDGQKIESVVWTDRDGRTLKTYDRSMGMETYRVSKAKALDDSEAVELDLLPSMTVAVTTPLQDAHHTQKVRYRVHLDGGKPTEVFPAGPTQAIESIDPHTAEITVYAIRPGRSDGNRDAPPDVVVEADLRPNSFIQSDDPAILSEAKKAVGDETDPWRQAVALESYVHREIKEKNLKQAFATAAEVAQSREGDCTEHAVFLAALARALNIPARIVVGLVYMQNAQAFGYHAWTEVYIDGRWIPIDGTLALGGIGAGHLKIAHANLDGASAYSAFLPVVKILGRLKIEMIEAKTSPSP